VLRGCLFGCSAHGCTGSTLAQLLDKTSRRNQRQDSLALWRGLIVLWYSDALLHFCVSYLDGPLGHAKLYIASGESLFPLLSFFPFYYCCRWIWQWRNSQFGRSPSYVENKGDFVRSDMQNVSSFLEIKFSGENSSFIPSEGLCKVFVGMGIWSSGKILASGARGREFDSPNTPILLCPRSSAG
jgi:hypothetical protein